LRPGRRDNTSVAPGSPPTPVIKYVGEQEGDNESVGAEGSIPAPAAKASTSIAPVDQRRLRSIPIPGEHSAPGHKPWRRSIARLAVLPAVALAVAGAAFLAGKSDWFQREGAPKWGVGTPGIKQTAKGARVRWQKDSIDVVVDKSFSELAGPNVFNAAVDAWRATGATLPSVSTQSGKDRQIGYKSKGENENVVVFAPFGYARANGALAITVLSFEEATGRIVDADILLNGGGRFFQQFDTDESSGDFISIDGTGVPASDATPTNSKTAKFDVQSVITHELGHFFGLGEDFDDDKATMYVSTRHGETHKRVVTKSESDVVAALYAEDTTASTDESGDTRGGCGGAQLARSRSSSSAWIGFVVAGLGLGLYAAARRRSAEKLVRIEDTARYAKAARRMKRIGGWMTVVGLATLLAPPNVEAAPEEAAPRGDAEVEIVKSEPRWVDGLVETSLTYRVTSCHVSNCPQGDQQVVALGGKLDGITQIVGPFAMPEVGAHVAIGLRDGRGLLKTLRLNLQP
jgi:hypothetical protein